MWTFSIYSFRLYRKYVTNEAPQYLSEKLVRVADISSHRLRSSSTSQLMVPHYRLSTVGSRSFSVAGAAGPTLWNQLPLPTNITSSSSLPEFKRKLKTNLFRYPYPNNV